MRKSVPYLSPLHSPGLNSLNGPASSGRRNKNVSDLFFEEKRSDTNFPSIFGFSHFPRSEFKTDRRRNRRKMGETGGFGEGRPTDLGRMPWEEASVAQRQEGARRLFLANLR